jgi:hypothetical protein
MPDEEQPEGGEPQQAELSETEVVEPNPDLTPDVEALSTFSEQEGPLSLRILPVIEGGQTDWRILVYMQGAQGPVYQSRDGMTNVARDQLGISERLQTRVNDALAYAKAELEVPDGLGDQKREKRSLHELEVMMGGE